MRLNQLKKHNSAEILLLLLVSDFLVILAHLAFKLFSSGNSSYWLIGQDRSFGESFQYFKEFWLFCSFAILTKIRSERSYLALSLLFLYLFVDDAFFIHERVGELIAKRLNFQAAIGLRSVDFGEMIVNAIAGLFFVSVIGCAYKFGSQRFRSVCKRIAVLVGCLAFFGVVVDELSIMVSNSPLRPIKGAFELAEDGGEMIVMSVLCWYGISLLRQQEPIVQDSSTLEPISFSPTQH
jgi:hypothetical protein